jgi:hypothetical protein
MKAQKCVTTTALTPVDLSGASVTNLNGLGAMKLNVTKPRDRYIRVVLDQGRGRQRLQRRLGDSLQRPQARRQPQHHERRRLRFGVRVGHLADLVSNATGGCDPPAVQMTTQEG